MSVQYNARESPEYENIIKILNEYQEGEDNLSLPNVDIITNPIKYFPKIKRGDIVHFGEGHYRNEGKLIFDGFKLILLNAELDEYDHLPFEFTLNQFPDFDYFRETIDHNNIRWLQITDRKEIVRIERCPNTGLTNKCFVAKIGSYEYK